MSGAAPHPRQAPIASWVGQMVGTLVLAGVVYAFIKATGAGVAAPDAASGLQRYALWIILLAAAPALYYLRAFKRSLIADEEAVAARGGVPEPVARKALMKRLAIGGALCELPMAFGVLNLFLGGRTGTFVGATVITIVIRLSYRPFTRARR